MAVLCLVLLVLATGCQPISGGDRGENGALSTEVPTRTPEPLVPTLAVFTPTLDGQGPRLADASKVLTPTPEATISLPAEGEGTLDTSRFGVGVALGEIDQYDIDPLNLGWYLNWQVRVHPARPGGIEFWQMVRVSSDGYYPDAETITAAAQANPGSTWLIGNEPDVIWQDNTLPERYAELYGELYTLLKQVDPTCKVAIGGMTQPTPLRLQYLDQVLDAYQQQFGESIPVDIWNVHNFILREERESWGVSIPPGSEAYSGVLYEIDDNDNMDAFRDQIVAFRRWMREHGQKNKPLVVSEYGIPMPADYGFDQERVRKFLYQTFDYFLVAQDPELGYSQDENRLVQWWCWYSLADTAYPTGNLFDPESKTMLSLGQAWADYTALSTGQIQP